MAKRNKGLGKGLGAILPTDLPSNKPEVSPVGVNEIAISDIEINPFQPRNDFDEAKLKELADSIKQHGIIQPLTLRKLNSNKYQLIAGERRLRAAQIADLKEVPAYIRTANDEQMLEMALIENIQRDDLNPVEIALSYSRMITELGLKQEELGDKVGKKRSSVTNYLRLLRLPDEIKEALKEEKISFGHGKCLVSLESQDLQLKTFLTITQDKLSVRQTEELVKSLKAPKEAKEAKVFKKESDPNRIHLDHLEKQLEEKFGNKVSLNQKKDGKGEIKVNFSSNDDLQRILELLDI
ncbi:MAG: ParB/RepB/Spo0J family partition protein [Bacteroidota bacterium]